MAYGIADCCRCYYPWQKGSSCTGPTAVDRIQNTINGVVKIFILDQILKALKMGSLYKKGSTMNDNRCWAMTMNNDN